MHFKLAYLKLTLFYVLIAMAISVSFSIAIYNISSREIDRGLGREGRILRQIPPSDFSSKGLPNIENIRTQQLAESTNNLQTSLIYFNLLVLLLATLASYFLAKKTLEPIKEAMEAQNRFTADASHELRTPLTAMRAEIEVSLRDKKLNLEESKKLLQSNLEEIEKLENLSNALLMLARHQDKTKTKFKKILLEEILVEAYEKVEIIANKKSIKFENSFENVSVNGDRQSLVELFIILIENAIKYSPEKSKIFLSVEKNDGHAIVKVKDCGIGIKACDLPHIFDRFYRSDISRSKYKIAGYGLGLSIAKNIVEFHGGTISVKSTPGKGSEFAVKFKKVK